MGKEGKTHGRFGRFFGLIKGRENMIDKDEMVLQFTDGRTTSLREMKQSEFDEMCDALAARKLSEQNYHQEQIRKARASVLVRIGRLGINTLDNWDEVNAFLLSPKIAGKMLYDMTLGELKALVKKLEAILHNGGLKARTEEKEEVNLPKVQMVRVPSTGKQSKYLS